MKDKTLFEKYIEPKTIGTGISAYYCGKRVATPNHIYGPEIRQHFLLVFVEAGVAELCLNNQKIVFKSGDILVMFPGEKIFYKAKTDWSIMWLGVDGNELENVFNSLGITRKLPIFTPQNFGEILRVVADIYEITGGNSDYIRYTTQSLLYLLFSMLFAENKSEKKEDFVDIALGIIKYNYSNGITVKNLADNLSLDASYLSTIFKNKVGISPKKYILKLQIEKATKLLCDTNFTVREISIAVGFTDALYFSRVFHNMTGMAPSVYRKYFRNKPGKILSYKD